MIDQELDIRLSKELEILDRLRDIGLVKTEEYNFAREILERQKVEA